MPSLRILHISDLHERVELDWMGEDRKLKIRNSAASRNRVLEESNFLGIIRKLRESGEFDLVCFTGDVADWGLEAEYAAATLRIQALLDACGVGHERLFLVPGNHDIQRSKQQEAWQKFRAYISRHPHECSEWMAGLPAPDGAEGRWREEILERSRAFWTWVSHDLGRPLLAPEQNPHGRLGYRATIRTDLPFPVHVVGLDSAWLAGDDHDARKLRLTEHQMDRLARDDHGRPLDGFRLALVHHPLSDLADERPAIARLSETVDLLLHGHQHDPITEVRRDPDRSLQVLAAGSLYEGDEGDRWINGFQVIDAELDPRGRPLRYQIHFWSWSERGHWYPSGGIYECALNGILTIDLAGTGSADAAPSPPPAWYLIPRPALLDAVKAKLLDRPVVALVGMPGAGKSTMAAALRRDAGVIRAFAGGIFWLTIGHDATLLLPQVRQLLRACGDAGPAADSPDEGARRLKDAFGNRNVLLVFDDVWRFADVRPFLRLGRSTMLITTRDWAVVQAADAWGAEVGPLSEDEALSLIERRLDRPLAGDDRERAARVAGVVGRLPLSIAAVCARIEEGDSWRRLLADLEDEVKRLRALEPPENSEGAGWQSIAAAFELSVRRLTDEDRSSFALLGLLAEDAPFTSQVAAALSHETTDDAELRLRRLRRKELLLIHEAADGKRLYQLHDEQRNAARRLLRLSPAESHRRLVSEYEKTNTALSRLPDDGYIHDHLAWHLVEGERVDRLHQLLREEHGGRNQWFAARSGRLGGYLDDLHRAFSAAVGSAGLEARYAMLLSSVASLESRVPLALVEKLVQRGHWSEERAWGHAISLPLAHRNAALCALLRLFSEPLRGRCFAAILENIGDGDAGFSVFNVPQVLQPGEMDSLLDTAKQLEAERALAVVAALRHFAAAGRIEELFAELEALERTDLGNHHGSPWTIARLASHVGLIPHMPLDTIDRLLARYPADELKAQAARRFAEWGDLDRAMSLAQALRSGTAWEGIAPYLREDQLDDAAMAAAEIGDEPTRVRALAAIDDRRPQPQRSQRLQALWREASRNARRMMVRYLPAEIIRQLPLPDDGHGQLEMTDRLIALGLAGRALQLLGPRSRSRSSILERVAAAIPEAEIVRLGLHDPGTDPWVLGALLPRWAELGHDRDAVQLLRRLAVEPNAFEKAVPPLVPHLGDAALIEALRVSEFVGDEKRRIVFLAQLAAEAPEELVTDLEKLPLEEVLDHSTIHEIAAKLPAAAVAGLRAALRSPLYRLAVSTAPQQWSGEAVMEDLRMAADSIEAKLEEIRDLPLSDWGKHYRDLRAATDYFVRARETCPGHAIEEVETIARRVVPHFGLDAPRACLAFYPLPTVLFSAEDTEDRGDLSVWRLCALAAALGGVEQASIEETVIGWLKERTAYEILGTLAQAVELSPGVLDFAWKQVPLHQAPFGLTGSALVMHLAKAGRFADAIAMAGRIDPKYDNCVLAAQVALARYAPAPAVSVYLDAAWELIFTDDFTIRNWNDSEHVRTLMPRVLERPREQIERDWRRAISVVARQHRANMFDYLAALAPIIPALGGNEAAREAWRAAEDVGRWWP
jgi:hypothetical protein